MKKLIALLLASLFSISVAPVSLAAEIHINERVQVTATVENIIETSRFNELTPQEIIEFTTVTLTRAYSGISTYADVIELYIATDPATGKRYARRWNATRGYWVDPYWILIS